MSHIDEYTTSSRAEHTTSREKKVKRNAPRKYQSLWNINQMENTSSSPLVVDALPNTNTGTSYMTTLINVNFNKRLPKWLRWGAAKKANVESKSDRSNKPEFVPLDTCENGGLIGNLGLGGFIEKEEATFVPSKEELNESEPVKLLGSTPRTKSLINLSSVLLWPSQDEKFMVSSYQPIKRDPCVPNSDRDSGSISSITSSVNDSSPSLHSATGSDMNYTGVRSEFHKGVHGDKCASIPELIKVLFLTNTPLGRQLSNIETLRHPLSDLNRKPIEFTKESIPMPAWFVHENSPIVANMTYSLYRTSDYLQDLQRAIRWLEDALHVRKKIRNDPRKRSPSAPRYTADHRTRRVPFADHTGVKLSPILLASSSSHTERSPDLDGKEVQGGRSNSPLLLARVEMEAMVRVLTEACSLMDLIQSPSEKKTDESTIRRSAIVLRNTGINTSFPSAHQLILPQIEIFPMYKNQTNSDLRKILLEDFGLFYKIPTNSTEEIVWEEFKFSHSTLILGSKLLLMSEEYVPQINHVTDVRFKHVLPLSQIWGHVIENPSMTGSFHMGDLSENAINIWNLPVASTTRFSKEISTTYDGLTLKTTGTITKPDGQSKSDEKCDCTSRFLLIGCPPVNNWLLQFPSKSVEDKWIATLQEVVVFNQQILEGRSLCIKILNELTTNQVVYKYLNVCIDNTVNELKERALVSMNIKNHADCYMLVRYHSSADEERDFLLTGFESPFIIALSLTLKNYGENSNASEISGSSPSSPGKTAKSAENKSGKLFDFLKKHEDELREGQTSPMDFESFVRQLPTSDPIIPRDQLKVEFVLHAKTRSTGKQVKKGRNDGVIKPSELKKSSSNMGSTPRSQKNRSKLNEKTKSTLFLNNISPMAMPIRGARSMGSLNTTTKVGEIFGQVPEVLWPEPCLPHSLMSLFVIVYYSGVQVEGIFRRTAVTSHIENMREKVDENVEAITPDVCPPILAACVLKRFFNEIPGHVLGDANWNSWVEVLKISKVEERVEPVKRLIQKLPKANQSLLRLLVYLLTHIRDNESLNRMSTKALGTVWGPNLIQRPGLLPDPEDSKIACLIAECLLDPQLTNSVLLDSSVVKHELERLFEGTWESLTHSHMQTDVTLHAVAQQTLPSHDDSYSTHSDLGRSTFASPQESFMEQVEYPEEHSFCSSLRLSRSELSSLNDAPNQRHLHSHSSLLSTTTSSSAESQNTSPVPITNRIYNSPLLTDKRKANCLPRRKLLIRTEHTLPDHVIPPQPSTQLQQHRRSVTDSESQDCSPNRFINNQRIKRQISLPLDDHRLERDSPPPVPPRASSNVIQMPKPRLASEMDVLSPPVPPKPKPRTKTVEPFPRRMTVTLEPSWDDRIMHTAEAERKPSVNVPNKSGHRAAFRVMYSRISRAASPLGDRTEKQIPIGELSENSNRPLENVSYLSSYNPTENRARDRRHSSVDRAKVQLQQEGPLFIQNAPTSSNILPTLTPFVVKSGSQIILTRTSKPLGQSGRRDINPECHRINADITSRKHLLLTTNSSENITKPNQISKSNAPSQPTYYEWICPKPVDSIRPTRTTVMRIPTSRSRRPQSIDRIIESGAYSGQSSESTKSPSIEIEKGSINRSDSVTENDPRPFSSCVRRMSSHASTVSSSSNTLVSTSNEQIS